MYFFITASSVFKETSELVRWEALSKKYNFTPPTFKQDEKKKKKKKNGKSGSSTKRGRKDDSSEEEEDVEDEEQPGPSKLPKRGTEGAHGHLFNE